MKAKCVMMAGALIALASYPSASAAGRKGKQKIANSAALQRAWAAMWHVNLRRAQILLNAATTLLNLEKKNEKMNELIGYEREMQNYSANMAITEDMVKEFDELQYKITWGFLYVFELLATKYPDLKTSEFFNDEPRPYIDKLVKQILEVDVVVERAKVDFDEAYEQYTQP